ncbi:MAG TPA: filamentous hemagglutinin N-terminal domain-containing protein, partial [Desulfuromonadaceae bacterium]
MRRTMVMKRSGVLTNLRKRCAAVVALAALLQGTALANPTGPQVVSGQASFANIGNTLAVTNSPSAIINWNSFSIGQGQITNFIQQSSASAVLNRVIGGNVSAIYGTLQSNGKVFLINQNGILFGPGAQVNVNGLMASTLDIKNADFLAGRFRFFAGATAAGIENQGRITTPSGGSIYLIAPDIKNSGIITASNGDIVLAAGHTVSLVDSGSPDIAAVVNAPADQALNLGQIIAQAGRIGIYGGIIAQKGIVSANSAVKDQSGRIFFKATKDITLDKGSVTSAQGGTIKVVGGMEDGTVAVSGTLDASAPTGGNGGSIETSAARVKVDDSARITTAAPYGKAGTWLLDPVDVTIQSGGSTTVPAGGGTVSPSTQPSTVDVATLQTALNNGSNVVIDTQGGSGGNGDITVASAIGVSPTSTGATLTLNAFRNITINQPVTASGAYGLNLNLNANTGGGGGASFANQAISLNGGTLSLSGGNLNLSTGALIANAVVTGTSGLWLNANNSATLDGVTLGAPMTADVGSTLNISNGLTLNNTLTMVEG